MLPGAKQQISVTYDNWYLCTQLNNMSDVYDMDLKL